MAASTHTVQFRPGGRTVEVPDNGNLREVCLREGVRLYYGVARLLNCGGKARCGTCRVRVLEGVKNLSAPSPFERKRLPDPAEGVRLACQANVRGPMVVDTRA